jgi:hypothetical protein
MANENPIGISAKDALDTTAAPLPIASSGSVGFSPQRLDRLDAAMQAEIDAGHYAGISVMVTRHGKLVKSQRYGYETLEGRQPLREDATYDIVVVGMLQQQDGGNPMTVRPYPVPDVCGISRSIIYGAIVDPAH